MDFFQLLILAAIQGLTEFLPISSSGHLVLAPHLFGFHDQGLALDIAVHLGSLIAVITYFRRDITQLTLAWGGSLIQQRHSPESQLAWHIIIGTLPIIMGGLLLKSIVEDELRMPWIIASATIGFGLLLAWADWRGKRAKGVHDINMQTALIIGCSQILALIPGTSRSGITITTGLLLGMTREAATRFSLLLSIPTILAASLLMLIDLIQATQPIAWLDLITGSILSAITAYLCIHLFLRFVERIGMWPFVIYRLLLGGFIFWLIF